MSKYNPTIGIPDSARDEKNNHESTVSVEIAIDDAFATESDKIPTIDNEDTVTLHLENIGGIDTANMALHSGVTVLAGHNATNRTSALIGLCAALGADEAALPSHTLSTDADAGQATLTIGDETYTRTYERTDSGTVRTGGDPFTEAAEVVDTFVALFEGNPARRAVERGSDPEELRDILMRPVDTAAIDQKSSELEEERRRIETRLDDIKDERRQLPTLEERRNELESELEGISEDIGTVEQEIEDYDADEEEIERAEELLEELQDLRGNLSDIEERIDYHQDKADEYRSELEDTTTELDEREVPEEEINRINEEISQYQRQKRRIESTIADLDSLIGANEDFISDDPDRFEAGDANARNKTTADKLTSALDPDAETVRCWTCGTEIEKGAIESRLDTLRELRTEKRAEVSDLESEIGDLKREKQELENKRDEYETLVSRAETLEEKIEYHESEKDSLESDASDLREDITALEERVEETEQLRESDLVNAYQQLSKLEYERGRLEQEIEDIEAKLERIEELGDEREDLDKAREELSEALDALRGHVDTAERAIVDAFNDHMENIVDRLDYGNIARAWLERKPGDGAADPGAFELHIVRESDDGSMYEDTVGTLSESEREVVGLVVALTGYLVHRVYDDIPFIVLDSVEAIDASRLATLLDYIGQRTGFLVAALLPEDADSIQSYEDAETVITRIEATSF